MASVGSKVCIRDESSGDLLWDCVPDMALLTPDVKTFFKHGTTTYKLERVVVTLGVLDPDTGVMQGSTDIYVSAIIP